MTGSFGRHPWLGDLLGNTEVSDLLGPQKAMAAMLNVEAAYARALGRAGRVSPEQAQEASKLILAFQPDLARLRASTTNDGVVVPGLVEQLKEALPKEIRPAIHHGLTSQDVIDTALMICLHQVVAVFDGQLQQLAASLAGLSDQFGDRSILARTRMQAALETKVSHRIGAWRRPVLSLREELPQLRANLEVIQFGGPVGDRASFEPQADELARHFASELGLRDPGHAWHTDRRRLVDFANWMANTTSALGKIGTDVCLMCQQGVDAATLQAGGKSSAMKHKINPVAAELLSTAAHWNAALLAGLRHTQMHEQERSGAAWTLEWALFPQMAEVTAMALATSLRLCKQIKSIGQS